MAKRKTVTLSVTFEAVMEVDALVWERARRLEDGIQIALMLSEHPTTKMESLIPECAQVLNVEDVNE